MFLPLWSLAINKLFGVFSFNTLSWIAFISSFLYRWGENDISRLMGWAGLHALLTTLMSCFIDAGSYFAVIYRHDRQNIYLFSDVMGYTFLCSPEVARCCRDWDWPDRRWKYFTGHLGSSWQLLIFVKSLDYHKKTYRII